MLRELGIILAACALGVVLMLLGLPQDWWVFIVVAVTVWQVVRAIRQNGDT
jgi:hypothetical protein